MQECFGKVITRGSSWMTIDANENVTWEMVDIIDTLHSLTLCPWLTSALTKGNVRSFPSSLWRRPTYSSERKRFPAM